MRNEAWQVRLRWAERKRLSTDTPLLKNVDDFLYAFVFTLGTELQSAKSSRLSHINAGVIRIEVDAALWETEEFTKEAMNIFFAGDPFHLRFP